MAKRPSWKKPCRGSVARKFGLPRPALSIERLLSLATWMRASLSSKGLRVASFSISLKSMDISCLRRMTTERARKAAAARGSGRAGEGSSGEGDHQRPEQREQHVGQRVGDGERHRGHRVAGLVQHLAEGR